MIYIYRTNSLSCHTEFIINHSYEFHKKNPVYYVTPESSKAIIERLVLDSYRDSNKNIQICNDGNSITVDSSLVDGDVLSFIRLAGRICDMCGLVTDSFSDSIVLRTVIYKILSEHREEFITFNKFIGRFEYVDGIIELLGDFTRYGIDEDKISLAYEAAFEEDSQSVYCNKLHDFKLLMGYLNELGEANNTNFLSDTLSSANSLLERIVNNLDLLNQRRYREFSSFINGTFVVIGFGAVRLLTPQELTFIKLLNSLGADFVFYPISSEGDSTNDQTVYTNGDEFIKSLSRICSDVKIETIKFEDSSDDGLYQAALDYSFKTTRDDSSITKTDNVIGVSIEGVDDRIAYIANEIINLTRNEDYRYRDIKIICVDDSIVPRLKSVLSKFSLDVFVDRKILISNTPVFRFALLLAQLPIHNFRVDEVIKIMRTGLLDIIPTDVDLFDNYCASKNINDGRRLFDQSFFISSGKYFMTIYRDGEVIPAGEYIWSNIIERILMPLHDVAMRIYNANLLADKALFLCEYIDTFKDRLTLLAEELVDRHDSDRASAIVRGYREVMLLLTSLTRDMFKVDIKQEFFVSMIRIDMRNKSQGSIPLMVDSVDIVTPEQAIMSSSKVAFIIGATNENFPYSRQIDGLLTIDELKKLSIGSEVELPDKFQMRSRSEFVISALLLNAISERVYFVNEYGKSDSNVYKHYCNYMKSPELINCFKSPLVGSPVSRRYEYESASIPGEIIRDLTGDKVTLSVTSLERYNSCHLEYMLYDILKIKKREDNRELKTNDIGVLIHAMFEDCLKDFKSTLNTGDDYLKLVDDLLSDKKKLSDLSLKYLNNYSENSVNSNEKTDEFMRHPGIKARRIFEYALPQILRDIGNTHYLPSDFEKRIGSEGTNSTYITSSEVEFGFTGSIDRIDANENTNMLRIIDYKTGSKEVKLKKALAGVQIQLFAYANSIAELGEVDSVGYFPIGLKVEKGRDIDIHPEMSKLSKDDLDSVKAYVNNIISDSCEGILTGKADALVSPVSRNSQCECTYCPYISVCGNDRIKPKRRNDEFFESIKGKKLKESDYLEEIIRRTDEQ